MKKCERLQFVTRAEWRRWLASNHTQRDGVWLVSWKKHTGKQTISYDEAVSEALAFGWVDSRPAKLDDDRTMLYYCPRRRGSGWSGYGGPPPPFGPPLVSRNNGNRLLSFGSSEVSCCKGLYLHDRHAGG
jgi:hypothetical protein